MESPAGNLIRAIFVLHVDCGFTRTNALLESEAGFVAGD